MKPRSVSIQTRVILPRRGTAPVFVKALSSSDRDVLRLYRQRLDRERVCLELLRGLAVPRLVDVPASELAAILPRHPTVWLTQELVGGSNLHRLPRLRVGAWMFVVEQLCAFRRCGILHTDVHCANVVATATGDAVHIVDFGIAAPVPNRAARIAEVGYTPGAAPPEIVAGESPTERTLVYQLGALLLHVVSGRRHGRTLSRAVADRLAPDLCALALRCVAKCPAARPASYDAVYAEARSAMRGESHRRWSALRAPYARRLEELGLCG